MQFFFNLDIVYRSTDTEGAMTPIPTLTPAERPGSTVSAKGRWTVVTLIFVVTILNFVDRQTLSILAPKLRELYSFSATEYGRVVAAFQFGMMAAELPMGFLMDRVGVKAGLSFAVVWWSIATALHAGAASALQFGVLRFWMGTGEAGNYPGAVKTVTRWFAQKDRALAIGVFNSGSMVGSIIAPPLIVWITLSFGWRAAFFVGLFYYTG